MDRKEEMFNDNRYIAKQVASYYTHRYHRPLHETLDIHGDKDVDIRILTTLLGAPPIKRDEE